MTGFKTRLAPTPSGYLHQGNLFNFLITQTWAQQQRGTLLLRIDDLDNKRCKEAYLQHIFSTLPLLDIRWQVGPQNLIDFKQHWSQQHRLPYYQHTLEKLRNHPLVYACICTRQQLAHGLACTCANQNIPKDLAGTCWRMQVPPQVKLAIFNQFGQVSWFSLYEYATHFIIRTKEGLPAYHIASLVDDCRFQITHIVRGNDLLASTLIQLFLAQQLTLKSFQQIRFLHHPLITGFDGKKLSKSTGSAVGPPALSQVQILRLRQQVQQMLL